MCYGRVQVEELAAKPSIERVDTGWTGCYRMGWIMENIKNKKKKKKQGRCSQRG